MMHEMQVGCEYDARNESGMEWEGVCIGYIRLETLALSRDIGIIMHEM